MTSSTDPEALSHSGSPGSAGDQTLDGSTGDKGRSVKAESQDPGEVEKKPKDPKDPSRPRRKKARRACHACQRAHLTCGDERPCQRCVKRGLAEACCDGVRKKAKYLHDTPNEAFLPGGMSHYNYINTMRHPSRGSRDVPFNLSSPTGDVYPQIPAQPAGFSVYRPNTSPTSQVPEGVIGPQQYLPQTPTGPAHYPSPQGQQGMQTLLDAAQQSMSTEPSQPVQDGFGNQFYDANDISKLNFDPSTFNFVNHYGALEFGMLGHMATGAAETPPSDSGTQYNQAFASPVGISGFADAPVRNRSFSMGQDQSVPDWQAAATDMTRPEGAAHMNPGMEARAHALRSRRLPAAIPINVSHTRDGSGRLTGALTPPATDLPPHQMTLNGSSQEHFVPESTQSSPQLTRATMASANGRPYAQQGNHRNPSSIYEQTTQPYDYVASWHFLKIILSQKFPDSSYLRIAKALASIRPSFIAATQHLVTDDLILQEKCFQRSLIMYEDFFPQMCTLSIICRRTGVIAAVSDEFCKVTGWSRGVLLGEEPNLNENHSFKRSDGETGQGTSSSSLTGTRASSHGGVNTPRVVEAFDSVKNRALFLAELIDDAATLDFYDDYSRMAFGEPRGQVTTRMLVKKYRTKADMANAISNAKMEEPGALSQDEAFVDCACIWTIKRDSFETPMMIILNMYTGTDEAGHSW